MSQQVLPKFWNSLRRKHITASILNTPHIRRLVNKAFHMAYYHGYVWGDTHWLGSRIEKCPFDMWMYQEILKDTAPDLIVETGTLYGGSAYFLACMCDLMSRGRIISIDISDKPGRPQHPRIQYLLGSSTSPAILEQVRAAIQPNDRVMAILDSDHRAVHVLGELRAFHEFVTPGCYLIVEDTNLNGHPVIPNFGPGPAEAVKQFLAESSSFSIDRSREKFRMTFNPNGYLKKNPDTPRASAI
jgi:cephalosporin hydroxylase